MRKMNVRSMTALCLCGLLFTACGTQNVPTDTVSDGTTATVETTPVDLYEPIGQHNFDGRVFHIVYSAEQLGDKWAYESVSENGDILNDAMYRRDSKIAERYNVSFEYFDKGGTGTNQIDALRTSVMAGDRAYDLCINHTFAGFNNAIADAILYDFNKLPYLDFDKPWWNQSLRDNLEVGGVLLAGVSDFVHAYYDVVYFNKNIMDDHKIAYPYEKVKSGEWTWEYVADITKDITRDLNGDDKFDDNDQWGWSVDGNLSSMTRLIHSNGMIMATIDENGRPSLKNLMSDKLKNVADRYYNLVWNDNRTYFPGKTGSLDVTQIFHAGRVMMMHTQTLKLPQLRDVDFEFGIVPLPKYDTEQEHYYSLGSTQMLLVPADIDDPEFVGTMLEALAIGSYTDVIPQVYEVLYDNKFLRDEESKEMFEIIKDTLVYDLNWTYGNGNSLVYIISKTVGEGNSDVASFYASNIVSCQQILDNVFDDIAENYQSR